MGFWRSLFGFEENKNDEFEKREGIRSELDTTFITQDEEKSFEESIYGSIQLFEADVSYIKEVLPDVGESLEKQITLLTELLEHTNNEDDPEVVDVFNSLKEQYEEDKRLADGEYTISELKHQNKIMDEMFEKSVENNGIRKETLDLYISFISKVQKKVAESDLNNKPILTKVQRQKFNSISMESEYRIKMLELMYLLNKGDVKTNPFKDLSPTRQKIFSKMFFEDAKKAAKQYENLSLHEEAYNEYNKWLFSNIDSTAKKLNEQMANVRMIDDFSIRQLFDSNDKESKSFEFLKEFVNFKSYMNKMVFIQPTVLEQKKQKEEAKRKEEDAKLEAERKEKEELEKYKSYTDEDIKKEIYIIEHDLTSKGSRFVNILDFQKKVARAKGLLDTEENLQKEGIVYNAVDYTTAWEIIKKANTMGVSYAAFPDCQENRDGGIMIAASEEDKDIFKVARESVEFNYNSYNWHTDENIGTFPGFILNSVYDKLQNESIKDYVSASGNGMYYNVSLGYNCFGSANQTYKKKKKMLYDALARVKDELELVGSSKEELQDVMCYITVPAKRNLIPILEEFKKAEVSSYIEPVPAKQRNQNNRNDVHIYFERDQLKKFKDEVLPKIPGTELGIIAMKWDNMSMGKAVRNELTWPDDKEKIQDEEK